MQLLVDEQVALEVEELLTVRGEIPTFDKVGISAYH